MPYCLPLTVARSIYFVWRSKRSEDSTHAHCTYGLLFIFCLRAFWVAYSVTQFRWRTLLLHSCQDDVAFVT